MMNNVICIGINIFRIYLIQRFVQVLTGGKQESRWKELLAGGIYLLLNTGLYLALHLAWVNIVTNLIGISLLASLYTRSVRKNLFVNCIVSVISMACDTVTTMLFVEYHDGEGFNQIYSAITVFLLFICVLIAERVLSYKDRKNKDTVQNLPLILVPLCSTTMLVYMCLQVREPNMEVMVVSMGLLIVNFLILYLYNMLEKSYAHKYENDLLKQKVQMYANQMDIMLHSENKVRELCHDMKHHMNEVKLLAGSGDTESIEKYIDKMTDFLQNPDELVSSGNMEIDSVLNYMLHKAKKSLTTVEVKVQIPEDMKHSFDVNIILGNLLENAIEAAEQTKEKKLSVEVYWRQEVLRVEIANSYSGKLKRTGGKLLTTKEDAALHGIGLQSVRKIVEKYNGVMDVASEDNIFKVSLILYMADLED